MTKRPLTIAAAKGYLLKEALQRFEKLGIVFEDGVENARKLYAYDKTGQYKLLKIRPWDVPEYVEEGAADIGIVGNDVLLEKENDVIKLLDLKFGGCKLVIAGPKKIAQKPLAHNLTIATKYPNATQRYFNEKGLKVKLIKLYGAIELAPLTDLSDIICDLTATGTTLKAHKLDIIDTVFSSTALLVANPMSYRSRHSEIKKITETLAGL